MQRSVSPWFRLNYRLSLSLLFLNLTKRKKKFKKFKKFNLKAQNCRHEEDFEIVALTWAKQKLPVNWSTDYVHIILINFLRKTL